MKNLRLEDIPAGEGEYSAILIYSDARVWGEQ